MSQVFRVPGAWDLYSEQYSFDEQSVAPSFQSRDSRDSRSSKSSRDSRESRESRSTRTTASSLSTESSTSDTKSTKYSHFVNSAPHKRSRSPSKKYKPITVTLEHHPEQKYQFPFDYADTWAGFQHSLRDAYPKYKTLIDMESLILVNTKEQCVFIPKHYNSFIRPGASLSIRFKKPVKRVKEEKFAEYVSDEEEEQEEEEESSRQVKKKQSAAHKLVSWLADV